MQHLAACLFVVALASRGVNSLDQERRKLGHITPVGTKESSRITRKIEMLGSWWAKVGDDVYSPIASVLKEQDKEPKMSSLSMVEVSDTQLASSKIEDYYVAVGGFGGLPSFIQKRVVGGRNNIHIIHYPNMDDEAREKVRFRLDNREIGNRKDFHGLIELRKGFKSMNHFDPSPDYVRPANLALADEKAAVAELSLDDWKAKLAVLVDADGLRTRAVGAPNQENVQKMILESFPDSYTRSMQEVSVVGKPSKNIIAIKKGTTKPSEFVVVGAHYDSRPFWGASKAKAPGAEDNGSGVASLILMANAVKGVQTDRSIVFVAFTGEEEGLLGSDTFLKKALDPNPNHASPLLLQIDGVAVPNTPSIYGAIILDEVAFKKDNYAVTLETHENSRNVMDHLAESNRIHNDGKLETVFSYEAFGSDHMPFLNKGLKAVLTINAHDSEYSEYHKSSDTIPFCDAELGFMITKMNTGAILRLACA